MAARPLLVVVIVQDAGLRSALAAQLSEGFELLTATRWEESLIDRRLVRVPAVLIIDEASVAERPTDWTELLAGKHDFARIVVLTPDAPASTTRERLMQINANADINYVSQLFTDLVNTDQDAPPRDA